MDPTALAAARNSGGGAVAGAASFERAGLLSSVGRLRALVAALCLGFSRVFYVVGRLCCVTRDLFFLLTVRCYDTYIPGHVVRD